MKKTNKTKQNKKVQTHTKAPNQTTDQDRQAMEALVVQIVPSAKASTARSVVADRNANNNAFQRVGSRIVNNSY